LASPGTLNLSADVPALSTGVQFVLGTGSGVINTNGFASTLSAGITGTGSLTNLGAGHSPTMASSIS
jgi:hypothetical protein